MALVAGCGSYSRLLKTNDHDRMYRAALEFAEEGRFQRTLELMTRVRMQYLNHPRADTVMFYTGLAHFRLGDFESSGMVFDEFRQTHTRSPFLQEAEFLYAMGFYHSSPDPQRDQTATHRALAAIAEYLSRYPDTLRREQLEENVVTLTQKLHDKVFLNARTYYRIGRYRSAIVALQNALDEYPQTNHREEMTFMIVRSSFEFARGSAEAMRRDRYLDMLDRSLTYVSEFPEGRFVRDVERMQRQARSYLARFSDDPAER